MDTVSDLGTLMVGAVLVLSGTAKLFHMDSFKRAVATWGLRAPVLRLTATWLPLIEVLLGTAAVLATTFSFERQLARVMMLLLMLVFVFVQVQLWRRERDAACGCFGRSTQTVGPRSITRAATLAGVLAGAIRFG